MSTKRAYAHYFFTVRWPSPPVEAERYGPVHQRSRHGFRPASRLPLRRRAVCGNGAFLLAAFRHLCAGLSRRRWCCRRYRTRLHFLVLGPLGPFRPFLA